jgi:hypothetical protein
MALAGDLPEGSLWRMTSNIFTFMVLRLSKVHPSTTDAPDTGLFPGWNVHVRPPRKWVGTDSSGVGLAWFVAGSFNGCIHNFDLSRPVAD